MIKSAPLFDSLFCYCSYVTMIYSVKEIFYSLQGEGARTGRPAVFCRFSGCNLWSGEEKHRETAECNFCDTDFVGTDGIGGGKFRDAIELADTLLSYWPPLDIHKAYVVFTGGEPLLQLNSILIDAMHERGFEVAVETNGTLHAPQGIDWLCVSPKGHTRLVQQSGNELKLVYPQADADPGKFTNLKFDHFYLQPLAQVNSGLRSGVQNTQFCTDYCLSHPLWQLSLQTHKTLGIR
jgi:7-carboxy-7-deazaguanine synthase